MGTHVHIYCHGSEFRYKSILDLILKTLEQLMATQAEIITALNLVSDKIIKIGEETKSLLAKQEELLKVIAEGPVSPELQAKVDQLAAQTSVVDELVADIQAGGAVPAGTRGIEDPAVAQEVVQALEDPDGPSRLQRLRDLVHKASPLLKPILLAVLKKLSAGA